MFAGLQEMLENNQEQSANMPVRKFYKNTFGDLLNRAIFALTKKQGQTPDDNELFTTEGMIKFIAFQLLDAKRENSGVTFVMMHLPMVK